jgi:hypothetical protein
MTFKAIYFKYPCQLVQILYLLSYALLLCFNYLPPRQPVKIVFYFVREIGGVKLSDG